MNTKPSKRLDVSIDRLNSKRFQMSAYIFKGRNVVANIDVFTHDSDAVFNTLVALELKRLIKFARALHPGLDVYMTNVSTELDDSAQTEVHNIITAAYNEICS